MKIIEYVKKGEAMDCKEDLHIYLNKKQDEDGLLNNTHYNYKNLIFDYIAKFKNV